MFPCEESYLHLKNVHYRNKISGHLQTVFIFFNKQTSLSKFKFIQSTPVSTPPPPPLSPSFLLKVKLSGN